MMKSHSVFPPGHWQFIQPQTGWELPTNNGLTFDQAVSKIIEHRLGNPRFKLPTDRETVAWELDAYNAKRMKAIKGGEAFLDSPQSNPDELGGLFRPQSVHVGPAAGLVGGVKRVAAGIGTLVAWLGTGGKPVDQELADRRAKICQTCTQNKVGDWKQWFTGKIAENISGALEIKNGMDLHTQSDADLHSCMACLCYLPLKVWCPMKYIQMSDDTKSRLDKNCWMLSER